MIFRVDFRVMVSVLTTGYTLSDLEWFRQSMLRVGYEWPLSSSLLVANRMEARKAMMMTGTTTNGDEMCIARSLLISD
jgi:hypothetical protein